MAFCSTNYPKFSNATGHLTQAHLKIYTRMTKKEEGYGVAIVQSKSKPHPDGNAETGHCKTCAQITTNFNELRQCSTED